MKKLENCIDDNCIHTPSSCTDWNGGDIKSLGICNGDSVNDVVWEIVNKLEELAGEDISSFDIDDLLGICSQKAPLEVNLISILTILKNNDICLKDYIDTLNERISELSSEGAVNVNLKCYADFDNLGNSLSITRDDLNQLVIDQLCSHKQRIESLESGQINLQTQINNIDVSPTVNELAIATCINATVLPTSTQIVNTAQAHCDLEDATGTPIDIAAAIANVPSTDNARYGLIPGWIITADNEAKVISNLLLKIANLEARVIFMEDNCCAATCEDIKLGFTAVFNEDGDGIIIKFTSGAGTVIPAGFTDAGSIVIVTDIDGNTSEGVIDIVENFNDNLEYEILVGGLNLTGNLDVDITAKIGNEAITCEKCIHRVVKSTNCGFCTISASGADGSSAVIVYDDSNKAVGIVTVTPPSTTTTTTSI